MKKKKIWNQLIWHEVEEHEENIFSKFENFWSRLQKEKIKSQEKYSDFNVREKLASKLNRKLAENNMTDTQKVSYSWIFTRKMRRLTSSLFWKMVLMIWGNVRTVSKSYGPHKQNSYWSALVSV